MANRKFTIIQINANGIIKRIHEIRDLVERRKPQFIAVVETRLKNRLPPKIMGYDLFFKNRPNQNNAAGGIALYTQSNISCEELTSTTTNIESLIVTFQGITVVVAYNKKGNQLDTQELSNITNYRNLILVGDLNAKHIQWNNPYNNTAGTKLLEMTENTDIQIIAPELPTRPHAHSILDIGLTRNLEVTAETLLELTSDHYPVIFYIGKHLETTPPRPYTNYQGANWQEYKTEINRNININNHLMTTREIDLGIQNLVEIIINAKSNHIPKTEAKTLEKLPENIRTEVSRRNQLRSVYQRTRNNMDKLDYYDQCALVKELLSSYHTEKWNHRLETAKDNGNIWKHVKNYRNNPQNVPPIHVTDEAGIQTTITDTQEKTNAFANQITKTSKLTEHLSDEATKRQINNGYWQLRNTETNLEVDILTSPREVKRIISKSKPFKAAGTDGIVAKDCKYLPRKAIVQLTYIYNACIKLQYFPDAWKEANVIVFHKPGKNQNLPENYRPISLLNYLGKILERIINNRITRVLEGNNVLIEEQFGFRPGRSTELQLARVVDYAMEANNINNTTTLATLDMEKAYDTVWRRALIYKMTEMDINPTITKIVDSFLNNRRFAVNIKNTRSETKDITEGLPQGSVLSPTLFNIFLNDIPKRQDTNLAVFADDIAIYTRSRRTHIATAKIEEHTRTIDEYCHKWKLKLNHTKTNIIHFNQRRRTDPNHITINGNVITPAENVIYLGVKLDRKLNFSEHCKWIRQRAGLAVNSIYPFLSTDCSLNPETKIGLYRAYVRPIMTYAYPIWSSAARSNKAPIFRLETKCLRMALNIRWDQFINNHTVYHRANVRPIRDALLDRTRTFFERTTRRLPSTNTIGSRTREQLPYRAKHKVINEEVIRE